MKKLFEFVLYKVDESSLWRAAVICFILWSLLGIGAIIFSLFGDIGVTLYMFGLGSVLISSLYI